MLALAEGTLWARPLVLVALALLPVYWWRRRRIEERDWIPFAPLQLGGGDSLRRGASRWLLPLEILLLAAAIVGLSGPYRPTSTEFVEETGIDLALVLDVSLSMLAEDFEPNRLAALRRMAGDFLERRSADRVALVIFAKDSYVQSPLTTDDLVLRHLLAGVTVDAVDQFRSGGTAIGDALLIAADQLSRARVEGRDQSVILITDGESNEGIAPETAARHLHLLGIELYAIGVGGTEPVAVFREDRRIGNGLMTELDEQTLRSIAAAGNGHYYRAADAGALEQVFGHLSRLAAAPLETRRIERRRSMVPLVAVALLALFGCCLGLGAGLLRRPLR